LCGEYNKAKYHIIDLFKKTMFTLDHKVINSLPKPQTIVKPRHYSDKHCPFVFSREYQNITLINTMNYEKKKLVKFDEG
jgi:hypothetical protein